MSSAADQAVYTLVIEPDWGSRGYRREYHIHFHNRMTEKETDQWLKEHHSSWVSCHRHWVRRKVGVPHEVRTLHGV